MVCALPWPTRPRPRSGTLPQTKTPSSLAEFERSAPAVVTPLRAKLPRIDPQRVTVDVAGMARRRIVVRLPADMIADDLKEPTVWAKVQRAASSLRPHDDLYLIAFDQTWVAEAVVSEADADGATLAGIRIINTPQRVRVLFRDSNYAVVWNGAGYHVERISDGHRMSTTVQTTELAERELRNLYPKPVAGGHLPL